MRPVPAHRPPVTHGHTPHPTPRTPHPHPSSPQELSANPPLGYELQDAVNQFFATAKAEMAASRAPGLFDSWVLHAPDAPDPSFIRLAEAVHEQYPDVVTRHFVWGYGRQLWDPTVRVHGLRPLRVMVLGPAASGKSTQCALLSEHFGMPHINVGDLMFEEVKAKSALGLEAKEYMDASKTVPDRWEGLWGGARGSGWRRARRMYGMEGRAQLGGTME